MADLKSILDMAPITGTPEQQKNTRGFLWDQFNQAKDQADFKNRFDSLDLPKETKAALWDLKFSGGGGGAPAEPTGFWSGGIWQGLKDLYHGTEGLGESINESLNSPMGVYGGPPGAIIDLGRKMLRGGAAQASEQLDKARQDFHEGSYITGLRHGAAYLLPFVGPDVLGRQGDLAQKDPGAGLGQAFITGLTMFAPELAARWFPTIKQIGPIVKNRLNPVEQASQDFLEANKVDTSLGMKTGSRLVKTAQGDVLTQPGGHGYAAEQIQRTKGQIADVAQRKLEEIHPEPITPLEAGGRLSDELRTGLANERQSVFSQVHPQPMSPLEAGGRLGDDLRAQLAAEQDNVLSHVHPNPANPESFGTNLSGDFQRDIQTLQRKADGHYTNAWKIEKDPRNIHEFPVTDREGAPVLNDDGSQVTEKMALPVDYGDLQEALKPIAARYERSLAQTERGASPGLTAMKQIINGPRYVPASTAELDLSMLKESARTETGLAEMRDTSQGMAAHAVKNLQTQIDATVGNAAGGEEALANLRAGRATTAQKYDLYDTVKGTFGKKDITQLEPVGIFQRLTWGRDTQINALRDIAQRYPARIPELARAYLESGGKWDALGPETQKILVSQPGTRQLIQQYAANQERFGPLADITEPTKLYGRLTTPGDASVSLLQDVATRAPQRIPEIARAFLESGGDWNALGPETQKILVRNPDVREMVTSYSSKQARLGPLTKTELEPVGLVNALTKDKDLSANMLADVERQAPERIPEIARSVIGEIFDRVVRGGDLEKTQSALNMWDALGDRSKQILLRDPSLIKDWDNLFFSLKRLSYEPNPSGSGYMSNFARKKADFFRGMGMLGGGAGGAALSHSALGGGAGIGAGYMVGPFLESLGNAGLARMLYNPRFTRLLTKAIDYQITGETPAAVLAATQAMRLAQQDPAIQEQQKAARPPIESFWK